jgi:multisubunit Na+/H+ antiporter MnhC subunit
VGVAFVLLLLVSAGMVTVPGEQDGAAFVRSFYEVNSAIIVTAQVIGLAAAVAFLGFARSFSAAAGSVLPRGCLSVGQRSRALRC